MNLLQHPLNLLTILCLVATVATSPVFAIEIEGRAFVVEAAEVDFDQLNGSVSASGNVEMAYMDYQINADNFSYDRNKRIINYKGNVILKQGKRKIEASHFDYDFNLLSGNIYNVHAELDGTFIQCGSIIISSKNTQINDLSFTSCSLRENRHYHVRSKKTTLYNETKNIIAKKNTLYVSDTPILGFPTYIYSAGGTSSEDGDNHSIPEFGHNRLDGSYANFHTAYVLSPASFGALTLGASTLRGLRGGANHQLSIESDLRLLTKGYYVAATGFEGGATLEKDLYVQDDSDKDAPLFKKLFSSFSRSSTLPHTTISLSAYKNEVINYKLVDVLPELKLENQNYSVWGGLALDFDISMGRYEDEDAAAQRIHLATNLSKSWSLTQDWSTGLAGIFDGSRYGNKHGLRRSWDRSYGVASISYSGKKLSHEWSYTKLFQNIGGSPFEFDTINKVESDEIGGKLNYSIGDYDFGFQTDYNLYKHELRNLSLIFGIRQHCWRWNAQYNTVYQDFRVGFSLADSRNL